MGKNKTEMAEMENISVVETREDIKDTQDVAEWLNAKNMAEARTKARRVLRSSLNIIVKHDTPLEQVCMSSTLFSLIDDVFSATRANKIMARLGNCEAIVMENIDNTTIAQGIFALYKSAKKSYADGKLTLADVCEFTEKGVKMDKYAFSFYVVKN